MGTRATLTFWEKWPEQEKQAICCLYTQFDGYWDGFGRSVARILASRPVVNGMRDEGPCFNGPGDMAVQTIAMMHVDVRERRPGGLYMVPVDETEFHSYHAIVHMDRDAVRLEFVAEIDGEEKFRGAAADFIKAKEPIDE